MAVLALLTLSLSWILSDHFPPWTSFHAEAPAFVATVVALLACAYNRKAYAGPLKLPVALILPVLLGLILFGQWVAGQVIYGGDALVVSTYLMTFAIAWTWGYQWANSEESDRLLELVGGALLFAGLVTAWQVLAQWLFVEGDFSGWVLDAGKESKPTGNLGQPNQTGTLLVMASVAATILALKGKFGFRVLWAVLLLFGWAIVLTQSRTALLSAAVLTLGYFLLNWPDPKTRRKSLASLLWFAYLMVAGLLLQHLNTIGEGGGTGIKQGVGIQSMVAAGGRPLLWQQLLAGLMESPWTGYGWLQISAAHRAGAVHVAGPMQTNYAHNIILDLVLMVGIPLAALIITLVVWWVWRRFPAILKKQEAVQAIFLVTPFLVHAQLELPHAYAYFLLPIGLLLGATDAWSRPATTTIEWSVSRRLVVVVAMVWSALLGTLAYEYMLAEEDYRVNRFENRRLGQTPADYAAPNLQLLTQLDDMLKAMRLRAEPGMAETELAILRRASERYIWAPLLYRTALACALNGQPEEAERYLGTIKMMFPTDVYDEGRANWLRIQEEKYPDLALVRLP